MKNEWEVFCREYLALNFNGTKAYQAAYPDSSVTAAADSAYKLLRKPEIQALLAELIKARMERLDITTDDVLSFLWQTVTADANELIEVRRECCRHCYGTDFKHQYTQAEWAAAVTQHNQTRDALPDSLKAETPEEPDPQGGTGFIRVMPPMPPCPECFGEGVERVVIKDTRDLSPAARQLYAGAKVTNGGLEIKTHSRDRSLELIGRHLAMFTDKHAHTSPDGSMSPPTTIDATKLSKGTLKELLDARTDK